MTAARLHPSIAWKYWRLSATSCSYLVTMPVLCCRQVQLPWPRSGSTKVGATPPLQGCKSSQTLRSPRCRRFKSRQKQRRYFQANMLILRSRFRSARCYVCCNGARRPDCYRHHNIYCLDGIFLPLMIAMSAWKTNCAKFHDHNWILTRCTQHCAPVDS